MLEVRLPVCEEVQEARFGNVPEVSLQLAGSRHEFACNLLAHRLDPAALKAAHGKHTFAAMMREWGKERGHKSHLEALKDTLRALPVAVADQIELIDTA